MSLFNNHRSSHDPEGSRPVPPAYRPSPGTPAPVSRLRRTMSWIKSPTGIFTTLTVAVVGGVFAAVLVNALTPEIELSVRVTQPAKDDLLALPRGVPAVIDARIENKGSDTAEGVSVQVDGEDCRRADDTGSIDVGEEPVSIACTLPDGAVGDKVSDVEVRVVDAGEDPDDTSIAVKWRDIMCPNYTDAVTGGESIIGNGTFETMRTRWNAAVTSFGSPDCGRALTGFELAPRSDKMKDGEDVVQKAEFGTIIVEFDKTDPDIVERVKITPARAVDRPIIKRLLAVVAAAEPDQAEEFESSRAPLTPATQEAQPTEGTTTLISCDSIVPGVQLAVSSNGKAGTTGKKVSPTQLVLETC